MKKREILKNGIDPNNIHYKALYFYFMKKVIIYIILTKKKLLIKIIIKNLGHDR